MLNVRIASFVANHSMHPGIKCRLSMKCTALPGLEGLLRFFRKTGNSIPVYYFCPADRLTCLNRYTIPLSNLNAVIPDPHLSHSRAGGNDQVKRIRAGAYRQYVTARRAQITPRLAPIITPTATVKFLWAPGADIFARARHLCAQARSVHPVRDGPSTKITP